MYIESKIGNPTRHSKVENYFTSFLGLRTNSAPSEQMWVAQRRQTVYTNGMKTFIAKKTYQTVFGFEYDSLNQA